MSPTTLPVGRAPGRRAIHLVTLSPCLLVIFALAAAGCRHADHPGLLSGARADEPALRASQVADVQVALGRTLEGRGELEQAQAAYLEALKGDPARGDAWARLAVLYDRQGRFAESAEAYRKAQVFGGDSPALSCNRGYSYYLQRRWADAESNLRQAIALEPAHPRAHNNLGLVLAHTGRDAEALDEFRRAGCTDAEAHVNLALARAVEGDWAGAQDHYGRAAAIDPGSAQARKGLREINDLMAGAHADADTLLATDAPRAAAQTMYASSAPGQQRPPANE
jgi:Tfp pilus assembly protein PilF